MSNLIMETRLFNFSTKNCVIKNSIESYRSHAEFYNQDMINKDEEIDYIQLSIPHCVIPVSFYVINENNNKLSVTANNITTIYSFPYGNYNATQFITQFSLTMGSGWSLSLNSYNSVFTATYTINFTFNSSSTISNVLGFSSSVSSSSLSLTMPNTCNFYSLPRISFRCPELSSMSNNTNDILLSIPNNSKPNGQIYYQNLSNSKFLFRQKHLSKFTILITDDDGNLINFNGQITYFCFQFDIFRKFVNNLGRFNNIVEYVNSNQNNYEED